MNKIAVFDLDGTLLDTLDDLRASVNHALLAGGMPPRSREEVRSFVGNGIAKLIERSLPQGVSPETAAETLSLFKAHYAENCCNGTRPYDGVPELLRELKAQGFTLAVVSNKADPAALLSGHRRSRRRDGVRRRYGDRPPNGALCGDPLRPRVVGLSQRKGAGDFKRPRRPHPRRAWKYTEVSRRAVNFRRGLPKA